MPKQKISAEDLYLGQGYSHKPGKKGDLQILPAYYQGEPSQLGDWVWYDLDYFVVIQYMDDEGTFGIIAECRDEQIAKGILEATRNHTSNLEVPEIPWGILD